MIPYINRFHGHNSLSYVYKNGQTIKSQLIILRFIKNSHRNNSRVAVVVSKKIFKSAVKRNRIRRRVYECIRPKLNYFNDSYDIVFVIISGDILNTSYKEINNQIDQVLKQARISK